MSHELLRITEVQAHLKLLIGRAGYMRTEETKFENEERVFCKYPQTLCVASYHLTYLALKLAKASGLCRPF